MIVHRDPVANAYRYHQELGPGKLLDGSFLGIGEISVADVLGAA